MKYEEITKLLQYFAQGPIADYLPEGDNFPQQMDMRPSVRSESFVSTATGGTSDSATTSTGRTSPVSSKKKGFSKKIFGVFSTRSASISSPSVPPNHIYPDGSPGTPSSTDASISSGRTSVPSNRENPLRLRNQVN